jgi:hypothetical protein
MKPCGHTTPVLPKYPESPTKGPFCYLCWLYETDESYRRLWGGPPIEPETFAPRNAPCIHLGEVIDKKNCQCPGLWERACGIHRTCTIAGKCKSCPDYEAV